MLLELIAKLIVQQALVVVLVVWWSDLAVMSTRVGWVNIGKDIEWGALLIAIVRPALWRKGGRAWWCEGTEAGFVAPWHTRRPRGRELVLVWGLGSRGRLEVEEGGFVGVDGDGNTISSCTILFRLLWLDGMIIGGCVAKGLDEIVVLGNVAGKHVGGTVRVR